MFLKIIYVYEYIFFIRTHQNHKDTKNEINTYWKIYTRQILSY